MRLLVARHGNTFHTGDVILRVGAKTDLPLTDEGKAQTRLLGSHISQTYGTPSVIFTGNLKRLQESTHQIASVFSSTPKMITDLRFNELDYGIHDGMREEQFVHLVGTKRLEQWNQCAIPLEEWQVSREELFRIWEEFSEELKSGIHGSLVLVVTSNGIARFAGGITGNFERFSKEYSLKLATGGYVVFSLDSDGNWQVEEWNIRPEPLCKG